jgi:uncharacterized protein YbjT (DUF2867 family)
MNLVIGASGLLGGAICAELTGTGAKVRALVRKTSDSVATAKLKARGVDLVSGDVKRRETLDAACQGISTVISTATCTRSRQDGDSIQSVDLDGQLNLIQAARSAGVRHFVFISFPPVSVQFPLQDAKRAVEQALLGSGMTYTILQPTFFMEFWLSPALGFDAAAGKAQIFGTGERPISWISFRDVARFAAKGVTAPAARNAVVQLGGPEALTPHQVVRTFESVSGRRFSVNLVPESALREKWAAATDPLEKSFAGLMLYYTMGDVIDMTQPLRWSPIQLTSVRQFAMQESASVAA